MKIRFTKEFAKASAALLAVFIAGAGVGYMGGRKHAEYRLLKRGGGFPPREARGRPVERGRRFMRRLSRDLNLTPAQRGDVSRALDRHYERIRAIRNRMRPQINSIMREVHQDLRSFLDGDQRASFDRLVEEFEERRRRKWRKPGRRRPDAPPGP